MTRENFQIYTVQITGKCIWETFPTSLNYLIIRPHVKQSLHKFAQKKFVPLWKAFLREQALPYFWGEETLCFSFISNFYRANYGLSK